MHGPMNVKFIDAKKSKETYQYRNIKETLYKTNAAIWYNKICREKQLAPNYISIKINGGNLQYQKTITNCHPLPSEPGTKILHVRKRTTERTTECHSKIK